MPEWVESVPSESNELEGPHRDADFPSEIALHQGSSAVTLRQTIYSSSRSWTKSFHCFGGSTVEKSLHRHQPPLPRLRLRAPPRFTSRSRCGPPSLREASQPVSSRRPIDAARRARMRNAAWNASSGVMRAAEHRCPRDTQDLSDRCQIGAQCGERILGRRLRSRARINSSQLGVACCRPQQRRGAQRPDLLEGSGLVRSSLTIQARPFEGLRAVVPHRALSSSGSSSFPLC